MTQLPTERHEQIADHMVQYANTHGMWPTIEFIVDRWAVRNPEEAAAFKKTLEDEKHNLQDRFGTNEQSRKGQMPMRRVLEVPEKISVLINILFTIQKREYEGGEKQFWRDFGKRFPMFKVGD